MAFIPAPQVVRVEMRFTQQGQKVENVYHVKMVEAITPATLQSLAGVFATWFTTDMAPDVSTGLTLNSIVMTDLTTVDGIAIEHTTGLPASGTDPAAQPPMNVTVAVKWSTGLVGRSFRGRTYHLGILETQLTNSTVNAAQITTMHNQYLLLLAHVATTNNFMVVLSKRSNKANRAVAVATPIIDVSVDNTVDSQRRRLPHRGS